MLAFNSFSGLTWAYTGQAGSYNTPDPSVPMPDSASELLMNEADDCDPWWRCELSFEECLLSRRSTSKSAPESSADNS